MVTADDLRRAADVASDALRGAAEDDWSRSAGDLDWTCRHTLDHILDALAFYAAQLATRADERKPPVRRGDPEATLPSLLSSVRTMADILAEVAAAAGEGVRAFHPAGMADPEGFLAMGCDEILVHAGDICAGLGIPFVPPADLCSDVVSRLFPWAPSGHPAWDTLLWANGRLALPGHGRLDPDWYWHCAPLDEWDGTVNRRQRPAAR